MSKGTRRQGRELALKVIYSLSAAGADDVESVLRDFWENFRFRNDILGEPFDEPMAPVAPEVQSFAEELTRGVAAHQGHIDRTIREVSTNWALERMSRVDLAILRLATFELLFRPETPGSVVINEAIEIGKRYGTEDSPAFINGILDKIARACRVKSA